MRIKRKIQNWVLRNLLNSVLPSDVITYSEKTKQVFINKTLITEDEMKAIIEEVKFIRGSRIWALIQGTLAEQAKDRLVNHSVTIEDMIFGKAMLFSIDVQKRIFDILNR